MVKCGPRSMEMSSYNSVSRRKVHMLPGAGPRTIFSILACDAAVSMIALRDVLHVGSLCKNPPRRVCLPTRGWPQKPRPFSQSPHCDDGTRRNIPSSTLLRPVRVCEGEHRFTLGFGAKQLVKCRFVSKSKVTTAAGRASLYVLSISEARE